MAQLRITSRLIIFQLTCLDDMVMLFKMCVINCMHKRYTYCIPIKKQHPPNFMKDKDTTVYFQKQAVDTPAKASLLLNHSSSLDFIRIHGTFHHREHQYYPFKSSKCGRSKKHSLPCE